MWNDMRVSKWRQNVQFCVDYTELGQHMEDSQSKVKQKQKVFSTQTAKVQKGNDDDAVKLHWKKP